VLYFVLSTRAFAIVVRSVVMAAMVSQSSNSGSKMVPIIL
jgi:hypothetical protein